jgi:hypothetical protein
MLENKVVPIWEWHQIVDCRTSYFLLCHKVQMNDKWMQNIFPYCFLRHHMVIKRWDWFRSWITIDLGDPCWSMCNVTTYHLPLRVIMNNDWTKSNQMSLSLKETRILCKKIKNHTRWCRWRHSPFIKIFQIMYIQRQSLQTFIQKSDTSNCMVLITFLVSGISPSETKGQCHQVVQSSNTKSS